MIPRTLVLVPLLACISLAVVAEESRYTLTRADRLEYQPENSVAIWDLQGWYGGDNHKLWWKAEGTAGNSNADDMQFQLLYSRAVSAYFDLQIGAQYEDYGDGDDLSLAIGIEGLMPYNIETDAAAFLTEDGDVMFRAELERNVLLSQRLVLQPRISLHISLQDIPERTISSGITDSAIGLRLGYKAHHKAVPYIGVSWQRSYGRAAQELRDAGADESTTALVAGVRFWF